MDATECCAIAGVGDTAFTRGTSKSTLELHLEASTAAIDDAGLTPGDVDAVLPSAMAGHAVEDFIVSLGLRDLAYSSTLHMAGASVIGSVQTARMLIATGAATCVLIPAGRRGFSGERISTGQAVIEPAVTTMYEFEVPVGNVGAAQWFAQAAQRHMYEYGTTSVQLGHVAVNSRANANLNPHALMYGRPMTLEDHQNSRMITTPFRLFDCSLESDGAGAVVITSAQRARDLGQPPVLVAGAAQSHDNHPRSLTEKPRMPEVTSIQVAAQRALRMAGMTISSAGRWKHRARSRTARTWSSSTRAVSSTGRC